MPPNGRTLIQRVSRYELARNPYVWLATAGTFATLAIATAGIAFLPLGYDPQRIYPLSLYLGLVAMAFWRTAPPQVNSLVNHLSLAAIYVSISAAMFAFAPSGVVAMTSAMFIAALVPFRLVDRGQITGHVVLATIALVTPVVVRDADTQTILAVATLIPTLWVLTACVAIVMEAAEAQSDELEQLVRRDPLTGAGNRRMLEERLHSELRRHERIRRPLSIVALDLDGFKALNDQVGHAAGDRMLCHVADALTAATASRGGIVIRQGGDEFCVILPETDPRQAAAIADQIHQRLGSIPAGAVTVSSGIGVATYPTDAVHRGVLLNVADDRLRENKLKHSTLQQVMPDVDENVIAEPPARVSSEGSRPMSRATIVVDERIWWITVAMFAFEVAYLGVFGAFLDLLSPSLIIVSVIGLGASIAMVIHGPITIGSVANHVLLATMMVVVLYGLTTSMGGGVFGASAFVAPLTAVRLVERREIIAYIGGFTFAVFTAGVLSVAGIASIVDPAIGLALITAAIVTPVLAFSCTVVLEAAEQQGEELEHVARRDALTGAGNRRMLDEKLDEALSRQRTVPTGVVMVDLNGFKALNDVHGHAAGDQLLRDAVFAMNRAIGNDRTLIRLGGDEFCVLVEEANRSAIDWTVEALTAALAEVQTPDGPLTGGVAGAMYPDDAADAHTLLEVADERLRAVKGERHVPLKPLGDDRPDDDSGQIVRFSRR